MESRELRIGNWILDDNGTPAKVYGIKPVEIIVELYGGRRTVCKPMPIPLTTEILERCGFERKIKDDTTTIWHFGINPITQDYLIDLVWLSNFDRPFYRNGHFKIDHLHQLQNFFHSLTGTELEVDLNQ